MRVQILRVERTIDFSAGNTTGSRRYKPADETKLAERREKHRTEYAPRYRERHAEKERARWRKVAAKRRREQPEQTRQANRDYYEANRLAILDQKRRAYRQQQIARGKGRAATA
ncbi:MAG TPA: hypothetical protein VGR35_12045 [Tepidisphaeraceae bacterium]|nr:hypothetical protein [Tepidisphaeraceae bacterium]